MTFRDLPSVQKLLANPRLGIWKAKLTHPTRTKLAREVVGEFRERLARGESLDPQASCETALGLRYEATSSLGMKRVLNATGILLHTNLGRAPLGRPLLDAMAEELSGYCTLEWEQGRRGSRTAVVERLARLYWDAPGVCVVNNNAAALVLILHTLWGGKGVAVSRGELVQIGGGFRVPEILEAAGAHLVEVGTTNITTARDFEKALERGAVSMLLRVHPSNFYLEGHTEEASPIELARLAKSHRVPFVVDMGTSDETVSATLEKGADLVCFSGDKLLGGPQAGIILGKSELTAALKQSPLYRALRLGKLDLFCLERTLSQRIKGESTLLETLQHTPYEALEARANRLAEAVGARVRRGRSPLGGGADPRSELESPLVVLEPTDAEKVAERLLGGEPPLVVRREKGALLLDLRTILPEDDENVLRCLRGACTS